MCQVSICAAWVSQSGCPAPGPRRTGKSPSRRWPRSHAGSALPGSPSPDKRDFFFEVEKHVIIILLTILYKRKSIMKRQQIILSNLNYCYFKSSHKKKIIIIKYIFVFNNTLWWISCMPTSRVRTSRQEVPRSAMRASASSRRLPCSTPDVTWTLEYPCYFNFNKKIDTMFSSL